MKKHYKMLFGCLLCVAAICLGASASVTITATPTITMTPPSTQLIAINQTVTINYADDLQLSSVPATFSYSLTWNCYVNNVENQAFPTSVSKPDINYQISNTAAGSGSFPLSESDPGTYTVYCTAEGIATPEGLSSQSISGTTTSVTFTVVSCTGSATIGPPEENDDEPASYIQLDWPINATMNPANSGNPTQTTSWYQGIDGDLTRHSPNLDIDCDNGNNDDPPAKNPTITLASQAPGSGEVTFTFNVQQYDYTWDICDQDTCPPPPADAVENVKVIPITQQHPKFIFQCGT